MTGTGMEREVAGRDLARFARRSLDQDVRELAGRVRAFARREGAGLAAAAVAVALVSIFAGPVTGPWPTGRDAFCYWLPSLTSPYSFSNWTAPVAYVYSPAFLQALAPLKLLSWQAFLVAWTTILVAAIRYLSGPRLFAAAIAFSVLELTGGNIHLLLAAAIVAGFRWPAAWALVLLTKVTPGIGLVWFAVRREWRHLFIALAATAAIAAVSIVLAPTAWQDWVGVLAASTTKTEGTWAAIAVPLWARLPVAIAIVAWGARTGRRWTVPIAAIVALPALWFGSFSMLLAVLPLREREAAKPAGPPAGRARETGSDRQPTTVARGEICPVA